jgi:hypothetical protein
MPIVVIGEKIFYYKLIQVNINLFHRQIYKPYHVILHFVFWYPLMTFGGISIQLCEMYPNIYPHKLVDLVGIYWTV